MKILHLAYRDTSGVPGRWAASQRQAGHETLLLVEEPHPFSYVEDARVMRWTPGTSSADERAHTIMGFLAWADVVMAYDHPFYLDAAIASGLPVLFRALGQSSREMRDEIVDLLASPSVRRASAGTADLARLLGCEFAGAPYPLPARSAPPNARVVCHAPSDREAKGTEQALAAASAAGWVVVLCEDMSNGAVLRQKALSDVVVDTCGPDCLPDGYGVNGVEAMAMGLPLVASASPETERMLLEIGSPAIIANDEHELRACLDMLQSRNLRRHLGNLGREFVASFHSPSNRAAEDEAALAALAVAA